MEDQELPRRSMDQDARRRRAVTRHHLALVRPLILDNGVAHVQISTEAITGLGKLAILPNEAIMVVLAHCTMPTLLRLTVVNRSARELVGLLPDFSTVKSTVMLQLERASPTYRILLAKVLKITTYDGLHFLMTTHQCEQCDGSLAKFRVTRLKVLCDNCFVRRR
ncbi:hypothetical protein F5Y03DRAFT_397426 [Xylaria venustula]|nr:hypothetical protein F5Y03DRAFT_397426 [Xylaria venustula]